MTRDSEEQIRRLLKEAYDAVLGEHVPADFSALLKRLPEHPRERR